jgi:hypothetical protein
MLSNENKVKVFKEEIELIFDEYIREFTKLCVMAAPDYFFIDCPASSTGKYHPISELGSDGTILHTKKVFTVAYELCRGLDCENNRDEILSACLIHDLLKQGIKKTGHTIKSHPNLAAELVERIQRDTQMLTDESYNIIRNSVGYHYGLWSINPWRKKLSDYTPEELVVYVSDYIASKRCVEVDYRR